MSAAEVVATLRADTSAFTAKLGEAKAEMDDLGKSGSSSMSKLSSVGGAALALGAALVGVGVASVDLAAKYQSTTAQIAANADISVDAAGKITNAFLGTAGAKIYSAQQIATAYASVAGQLGTTQGHALTAAQAMQVMQAAMDLAEGSGTDLGTATSALAATMQAFSVKANGAAGASNVLFNASRMTGTGVDTVSNALDKAKTKLGALAPPLGQMGGLLVDLTDHGEQGKAAMSALTTTFTAFLKPATDAAAAQANLRAATEALPPSLQGLAAAVKNGSMSSQAATTAAQGLGTANAALFSKFVAAQGAAATAGEAQAKMGVQALTASGQLKPLGDIIGQLQTQIRGMGTAQAVAQLTADGFSGASSKLVGVIQSGPAAFDKYTAEVTKANSAHAAAVKQSQTFSHQLETLKAQAEDYGVRIGQVLLPKLQDLVKIIAKVVEFFAQNKVAAIALAVVVGGILVAAIAAWTVSLFAAGGALAFITGPIALVIAAVALLAVGAIELATHWHQVWTDIKNWFNDAVNFLRSGFGTIVVLLTGPLAPLIELGLHWKTVFDAIQDVVKVAWDIIKPIFEAVKEFLATELTGAIVIFKALWSVAWGAIQDAVIFAWGIIKPIWDLMKSGINDVKGFMNDLYVGWTQVYWPAIKQVVSDAWNDVLKPIWDLIKTGIGDIKTAINDLKSAWDTVWTDIKQAVSDAWNAIKPIFDAIKSGVNDVKNALGSIGSVAGGILSAIPHAAGGPVAAGQAYLVGEQGPELFIPGSGGSIIPNNGLFSPTAVSGGGSAGGGLPLAQVQVNIDLNNAQFMQVLQTAILQYQRGNGSFLTPNQPVAA